MIKCQLYTCPKKYKDAWRQLLDQHLAVGRIRELLSEFCSPSFLIPKADPTVLPRWINNYQALNNNTIPDHYPLPRIESILSDSLGAERVLPGRHIVCQGRLSSHLQTSAVTDVRMLPHRLLTWHGSRPKGTKGLLEGSGVWVRVRWK